MELQSDIIYQDKDIAILHPNSNKGIPIWTNYRKHDKNVDDILKVGLKTGEQLQIEGIDCGRSIYHPYSFFRAPYRKPVEVDKTTLIHEVVSYYDTNIMKYDKNKIFIRVDPDRTYVYSSEIRPNMPYCSYHSTKYNNELKNSRKTLTEYLDIIAENEEQIRNKEVGTVPIYNLYSSRIQSFHRTDSRYIENFDDRFNYPLTKYLTNRTSEILVRLAILPPDYFVMCT